MMNPRSLAAVLLLLIISRPTAASAGSADGAAAGGTTGTCCFGGGFCEVLTEGECLDQGGFYEGDGTHCGALSCIGACCFGEDCTILPPGDCDVFDGTFAGFGTGCDPNPCTASGVPSASGFSSLIDVSAPFPNPAIGRVEFRVSLSRPAVVRARVLDVTGRVVATVIDGKLGEGTRSFGWNVAAKPGRDVGSGVYYLKLEARGTRWTHKFVMIDF